MTSRVIPRSMNSYAISTTFWSPRGTSFILREPPMKMSRMSADDTNTSSDVLLIA